MTKKIIIISFLSLFMVLPGMTQKFLSYKQQKGGIIITLSNGNLAISPLKDNGVRIEFYKDSEPVIPELVLTQNISTPEFNLSEAKEKLLISLKHFTVEVNKQTGMISYTNKSGKVFLSEKSGSRKLIPDSINGNPCFIAEQSFESPSDESIFGLGQFQDGHYNLNGITRRLTQVNTQISIPFIYSGKGYGLLWHQYGLTDFNPADNFITLKKQEQSVTNNNQMAEVTTTSGTQKVSQNQSLYTASFAVPQDGEYSIFLDLGDMDNRHYVAIDGKPCIDFSNYWLPPTSSALVTLKKGEHSLQLVCKSSNKPNISWRLKENFTTFRSPNAKQIDYTVFYGPSADSVIAAYRNLSGNAPLFPLWAYGFWQCRERYTSGKNLVETVKEFRRRNLPMDVIVQDWQYWGNQGWGVPVFDTVNYKNPSAFIKELHGLNAHFNISIWSNPDKNSKVGKEFVAKNQFIPNTKWLDYFNPETRKNYWNILKINMFDYGVDSWWMDAVEPENDALKGEKTYIGLGDFYRLTYPLMVSQAVYEGQRQTSSDKRVCILTRSAFSGQQRYGIINWSGDIGGTWETYKRQVVAGLNYTLTGFPYWTTDIGGFFRPGRTQYTDEKYQELLIRWFQWGTFNPIFRVHGYQSETEPWKYGQKVEDNMRNMLNLRYRLLPYIYSEAWQITNNGSTMMRPMVMDFSNDTIAVNRQYQYMFGKALLVAPVLEPNVSTLKVYLPKNNIWFDFWTGKQYNGGKLIEADAGIDKIPLFVKAGSIIPFGKIIQSTSEKSDTIELRVYKGADGKFDLYEDEGDNYNYEKGLYTLIPLIWNEKKQTLIIDNCKLSYPGYIKERIFNIVFVNESEGAGINESSKKIVHYLGKKIAITQK